MGYDIRYVKDLDQNQVINITRVMHTEQLFKEEQDFVDKLRESVLSEGFLNPIVVEAGYANAVTSQFLDPDMDIRDKMFCSRIGGSRLMVAKALGVKIPALVCDYVGRFENFPLVPKDPDVIRGYFKTEPTCVHITDDGMWTSSLHHYHLRGMEGYKTREERIEFNRKRNLPDEWGG